MRKRWTAAVGVGVALLGCGSENDPGSNKPTYAIRIGALTDNTGTSAVLAWEHAIRLAAEHMNQGLWAAHGDNSVGFELLIRDSRSDPKQSQIQASQLVNVEGVKALVTDSSGDTVGVNKLNYLGPGQVMSSAEPRFTKPVPIACFACSSAFINDPEVIETDPAAQASERDLDNWLFRVFFNNKYEATVQTQIALLRENGGDANHDGLFKVSVYAIDDPFGRSSAAYAANAAKLLSTWPASVETILVSPNADPNSYDWAADLGRVVDRYNETTQLMDGVPDAIFFALLPLGATSALKAYRFGGYPIPVQAATAFRRAYILQSLAGLAEGVEGNSPRLYDGESGEIFHQAYKQRYQDEPEMLCSGAYDATVVLMLAALVASVALPDPSQVTPAAIRESLTRINDPNGDKIKSGPDELARAVTLIRAGQPINYEGASGSVNFDGVGNTFPLLVHWRVQGQKFLEDDQAYACDGDPPCALAPHRP
jgi:ABC-type branched-subunit amino acid transport system substrate-binding protein